MIPKVDNEVDSEVNEIMEQGTLYTIKINVINAIFLIVSNNFKSWS